ncbi:MAG TPA: hypothetical protein VK989_13760, partial [Polyangia bacterium]|nr:hypothetical protein [Polyangia bacterium]
MLAGLVGINVYVFFFNHGTAPRDVLNVQSTSKSLDGTRRDLLAKDAEHARGLLAASSTAPTEVARTASLPKVNVKLPPPRPSALSALPVPLVKSSTRVAETAPPAVAAPVPLAAPEAAPVVLAAAEQASGPVAAIPFVQAVPPPAPAAPRGATASASPRGAVQVPWAPPEDDGESATGDEDVVRGTGSADSADG